jgi:hypothetical protein
VPDYVEAVGDTFGLRWLWSVLALGKVRLFVRVRQQGCRIESVPLKRLVELSGFHKRRWFFEDDWLILEAF